MTIKYKKINWLNVILTSILYSDNSKKKLLNSNNELYIFLKNNFKITITDYKKIVKPFIKYYLFLPKFIKDLDMSYISLDYYKDDYYVNIYENHNYNEFDKYKENIEKLELGNNPDYIIINISTGSYQKNLYEIEYICKYMPKLAAILNLKNYKIKTKGLSDYKDEITFNNDNYKLDSCILENEKGIMTGIQYNNNKYVYSISYNTNQDKFIKYDWDIINKNGYKTLIYVKTSKNKKSEKKDDETIINNYNKIIKKISKKSIKYYIKLIKEELKDVKENKEKYKKLKEIYKYLKEEKKDLKEIKMTKEGIKMTKEGIKMTKEDYIKLIKKQYPYYVYLNKYKLDELKEIHERVCNNIYIHYDGNNSCYVDSLMVSLFNTKNDIIKKIILKSPLKYYEECPKLLDYGNRIRDELIKIYETISLQKKNSQITECANFRLLMQKYYNSYKKYVNKKYDLIEWTATQNDYADILSFLAIIFDIPNVLKYKDNDTIQLKYFVDLFPLDELLITDKIYIKDFYPKYEKTFESENEYGEMETFTKKIEYLAAPFLFILFNRILLSEKIKTKIIPSLKIKLKENNHNLYLNSIIIHRGGRDYGHYTCLYECKGIWYEYDDMNVNNRNIIGTFDNILNNDKYTENITGLFYS
jgi:hypothetical protein